MNCSIVIRAYNEAQHLPRLLEGIQQQTIKDVEIILVDSGSTDDTLEIAKKYPVKIVEIKPSDFSFGYSLNTGCKNASGDFLVFISKNRPAAAVVIGLLERSLPPSGERKKGKIPYT